MELSKRQWYQEFHQIRIQTILSQVFSADLGAVDDFLPGNETALSDQTIVGNETSTLEANSTELLSLCPEVPPDLRRFFSLI